MQLRGATAIVTGAGIGVGAASALRLAGKGCNVVVNYRRSAAAAEGVADACRPKGVEAVAVEGDVARDADCGAIAARAVGLWGRVDILVNSAGITRFIDQTDLEKVTAEDFDDIFATNVRGPFQMIRAVAPYMKTAGEGAIVNVSSVSGINGDGSSIPYASSKGALNTLTKSLARALAPQIRVNAVCPDYISGRWLREGLGEAAHGRIMEDARRKSVMGKIAGPDDIAETVLWLVEQAGLITGENLVIDAGIHLRGVRWLRSFEQRLALG